jgi:chitodextrinase
LGKARQATSAPSEGYRAHKVALPDTQAPTAPSNLSATNIGTTSLTLNWTAATDNIGVAGYDVYRNGTKINSTLVSSTNYNVTGLSASTAYSFTVIAKDAAGNSSVEARR